MNSCEDYVSELREKLNLAGDQLRSEKLNLYRAEELLVKEKERCAKELQAEKIKVDANEKKIKNKEARLEELKAEFNEVLERVVSLEEERDRLEKEVQKKKMYYQSERNKIFLEQTNLEKELDKIRQYQADLKASNKWAKFFQEKEVKAVEVENESKLKEEVNMSLNDCIKKIEGLFDSLREIDKASLQPKKVQLKELQETLAQVTAECEDVEKKNKDLEKEIDILKKS